MPSYLGNFPSGSSPVAIFSGAGSMRAAPPVNLSGVPAHLRAKFAERFNGFGAPGDNLVSEDPWYQGINWDSVAKGVGDVAGALSKVFGQQQVAQMSQAQQMALAQQFAAQQRAQQRALPSWVMPVAVIAGAGILGAILWKTLK